LSSSLLLSPGGGSHAEQEWPYELVLGEFLLTNFVDYRFFVIFF